VDTDAIDKNSSAVSVKQGGFTYLR
jgi:hypothetical protein